MKLTSLLAPRFKRLSWQVIVAAIVLSLLQAVIVIFNVDSIILPPITEVVDAWPRAVHDNDLVANLVATMYEITAAFAVAALVGVSIGLVIGVSRVASDILKPAMFVLFAMPWVTLIPLILVTLGIGMSSKVFFGALYGIFPILFNTVAGVVGIDEIYTRLSRAYGLSALQRLRRVVLPGAAAEIANGLQTGMAMVIVAVISIEMFGATVGLGYMIQRASGVLDGPLVWFVIAVTLGVSWSVLGLVRSASRLLGKGVASSSH